MDSPGSPVSLAEATSGDLGSIESLAREIWHRVYPGIISIAQIDYMLARMYDPAVMEREITVDSIVYFRVLVEGELKGFAAVGPGDAAGEVVLHKLYLHPALHGRGLGSRVLVLLEEEARRRTASAEVLALRVNKGNARAIKAYLRAGFVIAKEIRSDIGGGFVMDDYWMVKRIR